MNKKSPAARLQTVIQLYEGGYLCKCSGYDEVWDDEEYVYTRNLRHEHTCDARVKAMLILTEEKDNVQI